ncbi:MAG: DUF6928 family protein [Mycobacteriaceae bacterium]
MSTLWFVNAPDPVLALSDSPLPDAVTAHKLASTLFPGKSITLTGTSSLYEAADYSPPSGNPDSEEQKIFIGCYLGLTVISSPAINTSEPSTVDPQLLHCSPSERTYLLATDPQKSWGAFAYWEDGTLKRSFSASPVEIRENEGLPLPFEGAFWAGEHPLQYAPGVTPDPQALPFHPIEFAEYANLHWLGFRYTPPVLPKEIDPRSIEVHQFVVKTYAHSHQSTVDATELTDALAPAGPELEKKSAPKAHPVRKIAHWFGFGLNSKIPLQSAQNQSTPAE